MRKVVRGDDATIELTLQTEDSSGTLTAVAISGGATVDAIITAPGASAAWSAQVSLDDLHANSDWANGVVVVQFTAAQTNAITRLGNAELQVTVDDGGRSTWVFQDLVVYDGLTS